MQIALEEAEAREHKAIANCQHALKVFKFKKYKEGYEDRKRGVSPRYSLEIGCFLRSKGQDPPESSAAPATMVETSLNAPSSNAAPLTTSSLPTTPNAGWVTRALPAIVEEASLNSLQVTSRP